MSKRGNSDQFEVRLGRIRSPSGSTRLRGFFGQVRYGGKRLAGASRHYRKTQRNFAQQSHFARRVLVKAHIQRLSGSGAKVQTLHLKYIERDSAARDGERGKLYNGTSLEADRDTFMERSQGDRHQFRFIISPEDAGELASLTDFTRDLVSDMEKDLGTKLEWAAANHYDTAQPHIHLVVRGMREDGSDLVIPRDYVSYGLRCRAQELAELELGPVSELEGRTRMARMTSQERWTQIDFQLTQSADGSGIIDMSGPAPQGRFWERQLQKKRLAFLTRMRLAEHAGRGRWTLKPDMRDILVRMGERGDRLKSIHRAMRDNKNVRRVDGASIFDPLTRDARQVTGRILSTGIADDVNDRAFVILDGMDGKAVYVDIGKAEHLVGLETGQIVTAHPADIDPKPSDHTIAKIASEHGGLYSPALHAVSDKRARPEFIQSHVRRLEALRRAGLVKRFPDGSWRIPEDYLSRARQYGERMASRRPAIIELETDLNLADMVKAEGATWLDRDLRDHGYRDAAYGFGRDVEEAKSRRRDILIARKVMRKDQQRLSPENYNDLVKADLEAAGLELESRIGKPFIAAPESGKIAGLYIQRVTRTSGQYALIERAKDFTLVPWRQVMERNLGKSVTGIVRGSQISWHLSRGRSIS
ncbi:DUF3363 domain-containing protein [Hyphomonas sp.]|uniref:DUF3363 domain-containing protein n=1 Tax=Hyphomonas sp. TaxID=87 RepID=UPI0025C52199|nr:DUF3363 domain-containing protein [Hyphomonas sp.]